MRCQAWGMPSPVRAEQMAAWVFQPGVAGWRQASAAVCSEAGLFGAQVIFAVGFVNQNSVRHFHDAPFDALQFVAGPGQQQQQKKIHHARSATRLWPTPTLSTKMMSKPAASQSNMVSRVRRATPPRVPPAGEGRMKALRLAAEIFHAVLSPRMLPPERVLDGINGQNGHVWPCSVNWQPKVSMNVLLPTPGDAGDADAFGLAGAGQKTLQ